MPAPRPDVHVIGGGIAALSAAIAAAETGARVVLDDAAPLAFRGGNTRHSRNLRLAHDDPTPWQPGSYTNEELVADITRAGEGRADVALVRLLAEGSVRAADHLARAGVAFQATDIPWSRKTAFFLGGGRSAVNALWRRAEAVGVRLRSEQRVAGVDPERLDAPAVVVACGGSQSDLAHGHIDRGCPYVTGDVLRDLLARGARPVGAPDAHHLVAVDGRSPDHDGGIVTRVERLDLGMVVDARGARFADETADRGPTRYAAWGRRIAALPERRAVLVVDAEARPEMPPTVWPPIRGDSLAEIAASFGLDAATLARSAADCGRVGRPPFFAVPLRAGTAFGGLGVAVDTHARIVMTDGSTRPGLFAAGMIMAPAVLGIGYAAGAALTIGAVFGRVAGEEAARHALGR